MLSIFTPATVAKLIRVIVDAVAAEWKAQGHNLTGQAIQEIEPVVSDMLNGVQIDVMVLDYMSINNTGVPAKNIPYRRGSGAKESEYISGLIQYAKRRFQVGDKEAKQIAFAIATRHKREGMPTKASARFSSTGKRTGFFEVVIAGLEERLAKIIEESVEETFNFVFDNYFKQQIVR